MSDLNPSDVLSDLPQGPKREDTTKSVYDKRPGHISFASDRANFGGCRIVTFNHGTCDGLEAEDEEKFEVQVAAYCEGRSAEVVETQTVGTNNAITGPTYVPTAVELVNLYFSTRANLLVLSITTDNNGAQTLLITNQLDDDDLAEFEEIQRRVQLDMREWREARAARKDAEAEVARENRRLVEVGKKAEQYNLFEKLRKLEAEIATLKKGG